jgi:site-specific DNA recombinase
VDRAAGAWKSACKEVAQNAGASGLVYRNSATPVPVSAVYATLRNRLYSGEFEWNGRHHPERPERVPTHRG